MTGWSSRRAHSGRSRVEAIGAWQTLSSARPIRMPPSCPTCGEGHHLGYHTHYVVDGGKSRIILAALVTPTARDGKPTDARVRVFRALPLETVAPPDHG